MSKYIKYENNNYSERIILEKRKNKGIYERYEFVLFKNLFFLKIVIVFFVDPVISRNQQTFF